jgi:hypothetical protein
MSEVIFKNGVQSKSARSPFLVAHNVFQSMLCRQLQTDAIATRQLQRRVRAPGVIGRTNGVNDVLPVTWRA